MIYGILAVDLALPWNAFPCNFAIIHSLWSLVLLPLFCCSAVSTKKQSYLGSKLWTIGNLHIVRYLFTKRQQSHKKYALQSTSGKLWLPSSSLFYGLIFSLRTKKNKRFDTTIRDLMAKGGWKSCSSELEGSFHKQMAGALHIGTAKLRVERTAFYE